MQLRRSAVDAAMSDDFSQHAGQWLMQVDDATQVNELIDRYGKNRSYQSMREMLTDLQSLQTLRSTVKQPTMKLEPPHLLPTVVARFIIPTPHIHRVAFLRLP